MESIALRNSLLATLSPVLDRVQPTGSIKPPEGGRVLSCFKVGLREEYERDAGALRGIDDYWP